MAAAKTTRDMGTPEWGLGSPPQAERCIQHRRSSDRRKSLVRAVCEDRLDEETSTGSRSAAGAEPLRPRLAGGPSFRGEEEVLERDVQERALRLGEQLLAVPELAEDLDAAAALAGDAGRDGERSVDARRLSVPDRDPRRHGQGAVPGREQAARLVECRADDAAVRDPGTALVLLAERHLGRVGLGALLGGNRQPQPERVVAAAEAGGVVMGWDPVYAANGSSTSETSRPRLDAIRMPSRTSSCSRRMSVSRMTVPIQARSFGRQSACSTKIGSSWFAAFTSRSFVFFDAPSSRTRS